MILGSSPRLSKCLETAKVLKALAEGDHLDLHSLLRDHPPVIVDVVDLCTRSSVQQRATPEQLMQHALCVQNKPVNKEPVAHFIRHMYDSNLVESLD